MMTTMIYTRYFCIGRIFVAVASCILRGYLKNTQVFVDDKLICMYSPLHDASDRASFIKRAASVRLTLHVTLAVGLTTWLGDLPIRAAVHIQKNDT
jgi:hypothetical protein